MFWRKDNKLITNSNGNLIRCSECPCKIKQGINMYLDMWNSFEYTSYDTEKFTWDTYYYRYFPYTTRAYSIYDIPQWVDTETFMASYQNGR